MYTAVKILPIWATSAPLRLVNPRALQKRNPSACDIQSHLKYWTEHKCPSSLSQTNGSNAAALAEGREKSGEELHAEVYSASRSRLPDRQSVVQRTPEEVRSDFRADNASF
jgi:hypothetical protein